MILIRSIKKIYPKRNYMEYKDLTESIIGCAYRVYNKMGFGFIEKAHEVQLVNYLVATGKPVGLIFIIPVYPVKFIKLSEAR